MEVNENENMTIQNFWDIAKVVLTGKYIAIVLPQEEKPQIHNLTLHLKCTPTAFYS